MHKHTLNVFLKTQFIQHLYINPILVSISASYYNHACHTQYHSGCLTNGASIPQAADPNPKTKGWGEEGIQFKLLVPYRSVANTLTEKFEYSLTRCIGTLGHIVLPLDKPRKGPRLNSEADAFAQLAFIIIQMKGKSRLIEPSLCRAMEEAFLLAKSKHQKSVRPDH